MNHDDVTPNIKESVREEAEKILKDKHTKLLSSADIVLPPKVQELIHELQVHQIELEMQQDELLTAQDELRASHARYYDLYNKAPIGYCTISEDGVILESNDTASNMFGLNTQELQKKRITDLICKEDQDIYYFCCAKFLASDEETTCELRMKNSKGFTFWVNIFATSETKRNGFPYVRVILVDITENKNAQEEIHKLNATLKDDVSKQLEDLRKKDALLMEQATLAQLGEMINMIAHQWRQPLNAISGAAVELSLLNAMGDISKKKIDHNTRFTQEIARKMSDTIDEFMNFNKNTDVSEFSLLSAVEKTVNMVIPQFKSRSIALEINIDERLHVFHNEAAIKHCLLNILMNSRDAFDEQMDKDNCKIKIYTQEKNNATVLLIEDNAGGIALNIIKKVFNPYFTTKEQGKGTGLGLYMTKKMIEKVKKSTVSVESQDNKTVFKIKFPVQ